MQARAPMTPVVKLVFGANYDKTRLAEYACVLGHAKDEGVGRGELAAYHDRYPGGLKGLVKDARARRKLDGDTASPDTGLDAQRTAHTAESWSMPGGTPHSSRRSRERLSAALSSSLLRWQTIGGRQRGWRTRRLRDTL